VEDDPEVVMVRLGPNDRRFGFSVVGGSEEGFPPRIDEIASGNWIMSTFLIDFFPSGLFRFCLCFFVSLFLCLLGRTVLLDLLNGSRISVSKQKGIDFREWVRKCMYTHMYISGSNT